MEDARMKKLLVPLVAILILTFILSGCGGTKTTTAPTSAPATTTAATTAAATTTAPKTTAATTAAPTTTAPAATTKPTTTAPAGAPKFGGTLTITVISDPSSFWPPVMTGQTDGQYSNVALETLVRLDEKLNLAPVLATSWKTDANGALVLTLRKGVKFHDGSDFNAAVCKWNLEQFKAGIRPELKKVSSIDIIDDYTLRLNLDPFDNTLITSLSTLSDAGRMISQKSFEANGGKDWAAKNPVGTGPFQFVSATKDVGIKWKRFDGYWGGRPYLDGIEMKRIADSSVALMELRAGNLDILSTAVPRDALALQKEPDKFTVVTPLYGQVPALAGYTKDPNSPFVKLEVRQAISHAVDVKTFNDAFGLGFWKAQNQWSVPGTWGYNPNIVGYAYNPAKSKALLAAAGYPGGLRTTLNFFATSQAVIDENTALANYLNEAGFIVTLNPLQRPAFADMASLGKGWSGIIRQQGFSSPDPLIKYAGVVAGTEFAGTFMPREMVDLYNMALIVTDDAKKQELVWKFNAMAVDKYCIATYLSVNSSPTAKLKSVRDDWFGEVPYFYINPMTWKDK